MKGPTCKSWSTVLETRDRQDGTTYRRYECANQHRFNSREVPAMSSSNQPTKKGATANAAPQPV